MDIDPVEEFDRLSIREVLDHDSRPTFVLDLDPDEDIPNASNSTILPIFCNTALRLHERLLDDMTGKASEESVRSSEQPSHEDFKSWATGFTPHDDSKDVFPQSFIYRGLQWTGSTMRQRWRLISGNLLLAPHMSLHDLSSGPPVEVTTSAQMEGSTLATSTTLASSKQQQSLKVVNVPKASEGSSETTGSSQSKTPLTLATPERAVSDWTAPEPKGILSPHLAFARTVDWASTPLGPMETWSPEFRQVTNLCMSNPHPAAIFWGSDLTMLYNEAYAAEVAGNKHPTLMGTGCSGPFSELWEAVSRLFAECARTGISIRKENDYLPIERRGFLEETFFSWSWTPVYGGTNKIQGLYNAPFETTQQEMYRRRMLTINTLGETVAHAKTVKQFWQYVLDGLEDNHYDIPFAILYSVGEGEEGDSSMSSESTISQKSCSLEGAIGVPEGHAAIPQQLDLKRSREGFIPSFREAMRTREPTLLRSKDGTFPEALLEGLNWRGFGDPCHEAIIFPVCPTNGEMVLAFLLLGVNPRRPYDEGYKSFSAMLNRHLATSLASVMLFEEEVRRNRDAAEAAALEQEHLEQQLALQTSRLRRMTELSPLGMCLISPDGVLREANDRLFEMTGLPRDSMDELSWMECLTLSSMQTMHEGWYRLVTEHLPWSGELQLKNQLSSPGMFNGESIDYWVLFAAQPEFAADSSLRSIMGSMTDISHLKWAQGLQDQRLREAEETRRQQNEFIDITSHEMRNPLSAILQCADDISSTLTIFQSKATSPPQEVVESCLDAAETIALCVQHQKSIVDDILTVSKLASNLLVLTPVVAQPAAVAECALKMFDPELQAKDITVVFHKQPSLEELAVSWMTLDPSRVLQILINLMTNAIKFTAGADKRIINVAIGASVDPPLNPVSPEFQYIPANATTAPMISGGDWGIGQLLYLRFEVQDTGCGLTQEEKKILFDRFSQATPRTHAQYGGSGLGLFISRQLAELHGGQIGVTSEAGVGSTFGFFIAARRSAPPQYRIPEVLLPFGPNISEEISHTQRIPLQRRKLESVIPPASLVAAQTGSTFNPKNLYILVVEDNLINQKVLVKLLKQVGSTVDVANDGVEALALLEETHYRKEGGRRLSVILMDLEMPNMDGLTCVREIRKMEAGGKINTRIPIIAVTANVRDEQVAAAMESGMDDVLSKPFRIADLYKKIEVVLEGHYTVSAV
ncbi:aerobic respiration control sensor protein arcB [Rhizodiscina lignyota]|uniref:Aerobic respiration control sensor protein arcB n=1 Tax=Rhizodiscina lignyota TaxID=1504668 RepID=A0A9P4M766_9PEZI|nr:aerobic respiration control sensor protein arcB [Rhizodiscina lignyota]